LSTRKSIDNLIKRCLEIHHLEDFRDTRIDIEDRIICEILAEKSLHRETLVLAWHNLMRDGDVEFLINTDCPIFWFEPAHHHLEHRAFPSTVLSHDCHLHPFPDRETHLVEDRLESKFKGHFIKSDNCFCRSHKS